MSKYPETPKDYLSMKEYLENEKTLSYLQSEPIPDLPRDILRLIGEYQAPATKEDLLILHSLDPSNKALEMFLGTKDPKRLAALIKIISLPEVSTGHMYHKLKYALEYKYHPVVHHLYYKIKEEGAIQSTTMSEILKSAIDGKDYDLAKKIDLESYPNLLEPLFGFALEMRDLPRAKELIYSFERWQLARKLLDLIVADDYEAFDYIMVPERLYYTIDVEDKEEILSQLRRKGWNKSADRLEQFYAKIQEKERKEMEQVY